MTKIFISYVRENLEQAKKIASILEYYGANVFLDIHKIRPGIYWKEEVRKQVINSNLFLALFSLEYSLRENTYMDTELSIARKQLKLKKNKKWFLPVVLNNVTYDQIYLKSKISISDIDIIDFSNLKWEEVAAKLKRIVVNPSNVIEINEDDYFILTNILRENIIYHNMLSIHVNDLFDKNSEDDLKASSAFEISKIASRLQICERIILLKDHLLKAYSHKYYYNTEKISTFGIYIYWRSLFNTAYEQKRIGFTFKNGANAIQDGVFWVSSIRILFEYLMILTIYMYANIFEKYEGSSPIIAGFYHLDNKDQILIKFSWDCRQKVDSFSRSHIVPTTFFTIRRIAELVKSRVVVNDFVSSNNPVLKFYIPKRII